MPQGIGYPPLGGSISQVHNPLDLVRNQGFSFPPMGANRPALGTPPIAPVDPEEEAFNAYLRAIESQGNQTPIKPPTAFPRVNPLVAILGSLLLSQDPTGQALPAALGGYLQSGQLSQQQDVQRQKEAQEFAQRQAQLRVQGAGAQYQRANDQATQARVMSRQQVEDARRQAAEAEDTRRFDAKFKQDDDQFNTTIGARKAADAADATARAEAAKKANLEQRNDNLRQEIAAALTAYGGQIPPETYKEFATRIQGLKNDGAIDVPTLPPNNVKTKAKEEADENQAYRKSESAYRRTRDTKEDARQAAQDARQRQRDAIADKQWFTKAAADGIVTGTPDNWTLNPNAKATKDKRANISKLDGEIKKIRAEVDGLLNSPFTPNADIAKAEEAHRTKVNKAWEAIRREWQTVRTKRQLAGGQDIGWEDYVKEQYPDLASDPIDNAIKENQDEIRKKPGGKALVGPVGGNVKAAPSKKSSGYNTTKTGRKWKVVGG